MNMLVMFCPVTKEVIVFVFSVVTNMATVNTWNQFRTNEYSNCNQMVNASYRLFLIAIPGAHVSSSCQCHTTLAFILDG